MKLIRDLLLIIASLMPVTSPAQWVMPPHVDGAIEREVRGSTDVLEQQLENQQQLMARMVDALEGGVAAKTAALDSVVSPKIDEEIIALRERLAVLEKESESLGNRIDDLGSTITLFGVLVTGVGVLVAVVVIGFSLRYTDLVKAQAQQAAEKWRKENEEALSLRTKERIGELEDKAKSILAEIEGHRDHVRDVLDGLNLEELRTNAGAASEFMELAEEARNKPETQYSAIDWVSRGVEHYLSKRHEDAISAWRRVADDPVAGPEVNSVALLNIGVTLRELDRSEEAIVTYNNVISRFGDSSETAVRERVAKAFVNKGALLGCLGRSNEAQKAFEEAILHFGGAQEPVVREVVSSARESLAEIVLITEGVDSSLNNIDELIPEITPDRIAYAVMPFLRWVLAPEAGYENIIEAIEGLNPGVRYSWIFDPIRSQLDELPEPRRYQASCFVAFFEEHHDVNQLRDCLGESVE